MDTTPVSSTSPSRSPWLIAVLVIVLIVIVEVAGMAVLGVGWFTKKATWSAVFLNDNEIFFGHVQSSDNHQIDLTNVFYLQRTQPPQGTQTGGSSAPAQLSINSLVSSQIQCPKNEIVLDKANVLYTQDLQDSSFVVTRLNTLSTQTQNCFQPSPASSSSGAPASSTSAAPAATATAAPATATP